MSSKVCDPREIGECAIIAKGDEPKQLAHDLFKVPSQNGVGSYIFKNFANFLAILDLCAE